jgi:C4-dicarboxylate-specific signal transduction histidine kinase
MGLDRDRINNPTFAISNNQTFGVVSIAPEPESHLEEKSARDGLREDEHYERLRAVVKAIVKELQERRFSIRRAVGRIQRAPRVGEMLAELRDYERPVARITSFLKGEGVAPGKIEKVEALLREEQKAREGIVAKLEETIAIYQGQATLGKVVGIVLHEGNRAIGILRTQSRRIPELLDELRQGSSPVLTDEVLRAIESVRGALVLVSGLFERIQPLGVRARTKKASMRLLNPISQVLGAFEEQLKGHGITVVIDIPEKFEITAWENDLKAIFFNLVENSIYWLIHPPVPSPIIGFRVEVDDEAQLSLLHITDNGAGIPRVHIASEDIFEPHFSLRGGIGLGLPIAGEAATRNGFSLKAIHSPVGAHFILDFSPPTTNA